MLKVYVTAGEQKREVPPVLDQHRPGAVSDFSSGRRRLYVFHPDGRIFIGRAAAGFSDDADPVPVEAVEDMVAALEPGQSCELPIQRQDGGRFTLTLERE